MRPLRLQMDNFTAFRGSHVLDLSEFDLFAIAGPTGSGKSSLLDAMVFALYGEVPRLKGSLTEMIALGRDRMSVSLDFRLGERCFRVVRSLRRSGRGAQAALEERATGSDTWRPVVDGARRVDDEVARLLGLGYKAFTQAAILPQGEFARFLKSQPRDRRIILRDLLRLQVYERMRERAQQQASAIAAGIKAQEAVLEREYAGDTPEALEDAQRDLAALESRNRALQQDLAEREAALADLRLRHQRTRELRDARAKLAALASRQPEIASTDARLQAARNAAAVAPRLEAADRAEAEARAADARLAAAEASRLAAGAAGHQAARALAVAKQAAAELPEIAARLLALGQVEALLAPRDQARSRRDQAAADHASRLTELAAARLARTASAQRAAGLLKRLQVARDHAQAIGYDAALHARLDGLRDLGSELAAARAKAQATEAAAAREAAEALAQAKEQAGIRETAAREAGQRLDTARHHLDRADTALREADGLHAAAHLRQSLRRGEPCPVCEQPVDRPPRPLPVPELDRLREALAGARSQEQLAAREQADAQLADARAAQALDQARVTHARADHDATAAAATLARCERELLAAAGPALGNDHGMATEERLRDALQQLTRRRAAHDRAAADLDHLQKESAEADHRAEQDAAQEQSLDRALAELAARLGEIESDLHALESRIAAVTREADPRAERDRLAQRRSAIEAAGEAAVRAERDAHLTLERAQAVVAEARAALERSQDSAREAAGLAQDALAASGFADAVTARQAHLSPVEQADLARQAEDHRREQHALERQSAELEAALAGAPVEDAVLALAESTLAERRVARDADLRQEAALRQRVEDLARRLAAAGQRVAELAELRRDSAIYARLAEDLRSERFQAYLLEEAFGELLRGASDRLWRLSGRYTLALQDDGFHVLDYDNAREQRSADTLSGGETFLASLALALELSQQIQRAAGAVRLESLFIDEGFGSLDPETLETIAGAVENLPVGGRMVGLITHLPELTSRLPARVQVEKRPDGSRLTVHRS